MQTKLLRFLTTMPTEHQNPIQKTGFSNYVGLTTRPYIYNTHDASIMYQKIYMLGQNLFF